MMWLSWLIAAAQPASDTGIDPQGGPLTETPTAPAEVPERPTEPSEDTAASLPANEEPVPVPPEPAPVPPEPAPVPPEPAPVPPEPAPVPPESEAIPIAPAPHPEPHPDPQPHAPQPEPPTQPAPEPPPQPTAPTPRPLRRQLPIDSGGWQWVTPTSSSGNGLTDFLPGVPRRGWLAAAGLALLAIVAWGLGEIARVIRRSLGSQGALPWLAGGLATLGRAGALLLAVSAFVALRPAPLANVPTFVVIGAALAVGWSLREALPDLISWGFVIAEGRIKPGIWLRSSDFEGRVEAVNLRTTTVVEPRGERTIVPNRALLTDTVRSSPQAFTQATVRLHLHDVRPAAGPPSPPRSRHAFAVGGAAGRAGAWAGP